MGAGYGSRIKWILAGILVFAVMGAFADPSESVNVKDFGAKADGTSDDTQAIQAALDAAVTRGGICFLPAGRYRIDGSLTVPGGVMMKGSYEGTPHPKCPIGTVLYIYGGKGNEEATPTITLKFNAGVRNLMFHYPEQMAPPNVIPYPWTIQIDGELCQVIDVAMTNPYKMIDAGSKVNELHFIRNVFACPLKIGVYIDRCYDVGRVENVHLNPNLWPRIGLEPMLPAPPKDYAGDEDKYWNEILIPYLKTNLIGFKIGKTDWEYMSNCFVIFAKQGFLFDDFGAGPGNALITQSGADIGPIAVQINKVQERQGVQFANCQFMATIKIGPENTGYVKISNSGFWRVQETVEQIVNEGSGVLILNACQFTDWDIAEKGDPCIRSSNGRLIMTGCDFMRKKNTMLFEKDFKAGTITGCQFRNHSISNQSKGTLELSANIFE
ncbi:MAG: hypothetical protein FJ220_07020 [Kiritimatiellaceae bacterium]|nr:hypothetical protein [Kiritimatiellaceae bacterium]